MNDRKKMHRAKLETPDKILFSEAFDPPYRGTHEAKYQQNCKRAIVELLRRHSLSPGDYISIQYVSEHTRALVQIDKPATKKEAKQ